jgi:hypothetical protein
LITVARSILKRFRTLCRRGGLHKFRTTGGPYVTVAGGSSGYSIRAASPDVCVHYHDPAPCSDESFRLPLDALEVCEARDDAPVVIEGRLDNRVLLSWTERGVPRQHEVDQPKAGGSSFPDLPTNFTANEAGMWAALRDAVGTTDAASTRYALGCLHLRGKLGRIDATDGRQILTQAGYQFGFDDDLLIPASAILGCRDLDLGEPVAVGRSGDWISFGIGNSLVMIRIQKDGRFPKVDEIIPTPERAPSRLELSARDAAFLVNIVPSLPSSDPQHAPVTLDLNGKVLIRSRDAERSRPTEVELTSSRLIGDAVAFNTDRRYVERAMRLGFREAFVYGPNSPVLCRDDHRRFLWALLDAASVIPRSDDATRIESSAVSPRTVFRDRKEKIVSMAGSTTTADVPKSAKPIQPAPAKNGSGSPIEQTAALRDSLRATARQANELMRLLKRQKRQSRIVENTLASLKQLQRVAG